MRWRNIAFIGAVLVVVAIIHYMLTFKYLVVTYQNIQEVDVYKASKLDSGKQPKPLAVLKASGQKLRLRGGSYTLYYKGSSGYDSRYVEVELTSKQQTFAIKPQYSSDKLTEILDQEFPGIQFALASKYPNLDLYAVQQGQLYRDGEWYGTTLIYKGPDVYNSDVLRAVLHKENGVWVVKTNPPAISLSKYTYKDVPEDILKDVNSL